MARPKAYFTLVQRIDGVWAPQFGDHDQEIVRFERDDMRTGCAPVKAKDMLILKTSDWKSATVDAAIAKLNAK